MIVTVDMMKRVNAAILSGKHMTKADLVDGCMLDQGALEAAVGALDAPIKTMTEFFEVLDEYIAELQNRLKMMGECYKAIQKLQIDNEIIKMTDEDTDPAIIWRG